MGSGADSPCQGEMSRSDRGDREGELNLPIFHLVSWRGPRGVWPRSSGRLHSGRGGGDAAPGGPAVVLGFLSSPVSNRTVVLHIPP